MSKFSADFSTVRIEAEEWLRDSAWRDATFSETANIYALERDGGLFLKIAPPGELNNEALMTHYFYGKGIGAQLIDYRSATYDYLVTRKVPGKSGIECELFHNPARFAQVFGSGLRALHEMPAQDCPRQRVTSAFLSQAQQNRASGHWDAWMLSEAGFATIEEAAEALDHNAGALREDCLLHGDYCLPNVMIEGETLCAMIDVGGGGTGDRHFDIFWGLWSMRYNFKSERWADTFLDAYGRDALRPEGMLLARALNVFL